jgi:hypothetical protein
MKSVRCRTPARRCQAPAERMPGACRTHWNPAFTAPERTGSRVSLRTTPCEMPCGTHWIRASAASERLPDALDPGFHCVLRPAECPAERTGSGVPLRQDALDPGFHGVPAGPAHPDRDADGVRVTRVRYGARAANRATSKLPPRWCLCVLRCPCALWCARRSSARSALRLGRPTGPSDRAVRLGRPTVPSDWAVRPCRPTGPSDHAPDWAVRLGRPGHPPVPVSCRRGSARC